MIFYKNFDNELTIDHFVSYVRKQLIMILLLKGIDTTANIEYLFAAFRLFII